MSDIQSNHTSTDSNQSKLQMQYSGGVIKTNKMHHDSKDNIIVNNIVNAANKYGNVIPAMDFTQIKEEPIDDYSGVALFAGTFPCLFPGGVGDIVSECGHDGQTLNSG